MPVVTRREAIASLCGVLPLVIAPRFAFARTERQDRLVIVTLRGAVDGLAVVPSFGDPQYEIARAGLAQSRPGSGGGVLDLDGFFGLTPLMPGLHALYAKGEAMIFHAVASPYRERSHFDGQNILETGRSRPFETSDGWLNRALAGIGRAPARERAISLTSRMPLVLRGSAPVTSWTPSIGNAPGLSTISAVQRLYDQSDPGLARALSSARRANAVVAGTASSDKPFKGLMAAAGKFLGEPEGPCAAVVELGGWDTHAAQAQPFGALYRNLILLDEGVQALATELRSSWAHTAVLMITEFGRTVAMNGSQGTDHGTASVAILAGGAVQGGRVVADWPGLLARELLDGRDLRPTLDLRSIIKGCLIEFLGVTPDHVERVVFPETRHVPPQRGIRRPG